MRLSRHVTDDASCQRCGFMTETTIHILRDCPRSRLVWQRLRMDQSTLFHISDSADWIRLNTSSAHGTVFVLACWILWKFSMILDGILGIL